MINVKTVLINVVATLIISACIWTYVQDRNNIFTMDRSKMYYLTTIGEGTVNRVDSTNIVNCDLTGVSNAILRLKSNGFTIEKEEYEKEYFDVILVKDDDVYRLHYTSDGNLTSISRPYKNSSIPLTYIDGREK